MSETVKLIIEIPKEKYEHIKTFSDVVPDTYSSLVKNAIPLDDVKAEIESDARDYRCDEFVDGINHALEIIDNIGKGDKEKC